MRDTRANPYPSFYGSFRRIKGQLAERLSVLVEYRAKGGIYKLLMRLAPATFHKIQHLRKHRKAGMHFYWMNLKEPRTFNEKTCVSKIIGEHSNYSALVDKASAKQWAAERLGHHSVVPTIAVFRAEEVNAGISEAKLKFPCVLKPTHSSGKVLIITNRSDFISRSQKIHSTLKIWMSLNHFDVSGEPQYRDLEPRVICEEFLDQEGSSPNDYKFFCFAGKPVFVQVDIDRHHAPKKVFYDMEWVKQEFTNKFAVWGGSVDPPEQFDRMKAFASILSQGFAFSRVDLYEANGTVYFGEITFHHGSGYDSWTSYEHDLMLGQLISGRSLL